MRTREPVMPRNQPMNGKMRRSHFMAQYAPYFAQQSTAEQPRSPGLSDSVRTSMKPGMRRLIPVVLFCLVACGDEATTDPPKPGPALDPDYNPALVAERPFGLVEPSSYDGSATPLVLALHGLGHSGAGYAGPGGTSGLAELAETHGFFVAYPDGVTYALLGSGSLRAWNASCCGTIEDAIDSWLAPGQLIHDDVTYLRAVVAQMRSAYNIDDARIFIQGHSNGAFMAHLMACEASDKIAAIAPLAGTFFSGDQGSCDPVEPVAVLHAHGTADTTIAYPGGTWDAGLAQLDHIGAQDAVDVWLANNGCNATPSSSTHFDAEANIAGEETLVTSYGNDCVAGRTVELWTITNGTHVPAFRPAFGEALIDFFMAHAK